MVWSRWCAAVIALTALCPAAGLSGCDAGALFRTQSEKVAKEWSTVIRGSQVMPVYPLMEDLQPGDVFLVEVPIEREVSAWKVDGYLPLYQHLARLEGLSRYYKAFYEDGYWEGVYADVPHERPTPPDDVVEASGAAGDAAHTAGPRRYALAGAPLAAFPTYSFKVDRSAELGAAFPISGIPIALGLAGAESAQASVSLDDALAYGLATSELFDALLIWSWQPLVRPMLEAIAAQNANREEPLYLRVVNRVYLLGAVNVTLNTTEAAGGDVQVGGAAAGGRIQLPDLSDAGAVAAYKQSLSSLSSMVTNSLPGGQIKFGYLASGAVGLKENFPRPLAIGFIGFDVPLLAGGDLGAPVSTRARIDAAKTDPIEPTGRVGLTPNQWHFDMRMGQLRELATGTDASGRRESINAMTNAAEALKPDAAMEEFLTWRAGNPGASPTEITNKFFEASTTYIEGGRAAYARLFAAIDAQFAWKAASGQSAPQGTR